MSQRLRALPTEEDWTRFEGYAARVRIMTHHSGPRSVYAVHPEVWTAAVERSAAVNRRLLPNLRRVTWIQTSMDDRTILNCLGPQVDSIRIRLVRTCSLSPFGRATNASQYKEDAPVGLMECIVERSPRVREATFECMEMSKIQTVLPGWRNLKKLGLWRMPEHDNAVNHATLRMLGALPNLVHLHVTGVRWEGGVMAVCDGFGELQNLTAGMDCAGLTAMIAAMRPGLGRLRTLSIELPRASTCSAQAFQDVMAPLSPQVLSELRRVDIETNVPLTFGRDLFVGALRPLLRFRDLTVIRICAHPGSFGGLWCPSADTLEMIGETWPRLTVLHLNTPKLGDPIYPAMARLQRLAEQCRQLKELALPGVDPGDPAIALTVPESVAGHGLERLRVADWMGCLWTARGSAIPMSVAAICRYVDTLFPQAMIGVPLRGAGVRKVSPMKYSWELIEEQIYALRHYRESQSG